MKYDEITITINNMDFYVINKNIIENNEAKNIDIYISSITIGY